MHFLFLGLDTTLRFPIKELFIVEAIHSFDPEASSPSLDKNLLSLYVGERVVILGKFLKKLMILQFLAPQESSSKIINIFIYVKKVPNSMYFIFAINLRHTCAQLFSFMK